VRRGRVVVSFGGVAAASLALAVAACAESDVEPVTTADCGLQIRFNGVIYDGWVYTEQEGATRLGTADQAECHDFGPNAEGSVFPDDPRRVAVWAFDGYTPEEVVGVRFDRDSFVVYVNGSTPRHRAELISEQFRHAD
jgi:hypothetical protein